MEGGEGSRQLTRRVPAVGTGEGIGYQKEREKE
jgi:hypothetical protein